MDRLMPHLLAMFGSRHSARRKGAADNTWKLP
jgi:hypothetical protein